MTIGQLNGDLGATTAPGGSVSTPRNATRDQQAWLKELERAQWADRLRYQPVTKTKEITGRNALSERKTETVLAKGQQLNDVSVDTRHTDSNLRSLLEHVPAQHVDPQISILQTHNAGLGARYGTSQRTDMTTFKPLSAPAQAERLAATELGAGKQWESHTAHFQVEGQQITVWIRDATASAADGFALLRGLREELRARGYELRELFLNGHAIEKIEVTGG